MPYRNDEYFPATVEKKIYTCKKKVKREIHDAAYSAENTQ